LEIDYIEMQVTLSKPSLKMSLVLQASLAPQDMSSYSSMLHQCNSISSKLQVVERGKRNKQARRGQRGTQQSLLPALILLVTSTEAGAQVCHFTEAICLAQAAD
jgi:hypothetical protein